MRLFFAVELEEKVKEFILEGIRGSGVSDPPWRWIPPENFHITMKFLGDIDDSRLSGIEEAAAGSVRGRHSPFKVRLGSFGAFPSISRPRVLFYSVEEGSDDLASLAGSIEEAMASIGFKREKRKFHAHTTLARVKRSLKPAILEKLESIPPLDERAWQEVEGFSLMRSRLSRSGAEYERLAHFKL